MEPQAQLTFARLEGKGFDAASPSLGKLQVNQDTIDSIVGSLGVEAGVETGKGTVFGRLGLAHEFAGGIDGTYSAADGAPKTTSFDTKDTWIDMTLGGRWNLSKTAQVYADFTNSLTGDYRNHWKVNGGLKFNFSTAPINPAKETEWKVMESAESYRNMPMKSRRKRLPGRRPLQRRQHLLQYRPARRLRRPVCRQRRKGYLRQHPSPSIVAGRQRRQKR